MHVYIHHLSIQVAIYQPATPQSIHRSFTTHECISLSSTHPSFVSTCHCELYFLDTPLRGLQPRTRRCKQMWWEARRDASGQSACCENTDLSLDPQSPYKASQSATHLKYSILGVRQKAEMGLWKLAGQLVWIMQQWTPNRFRFK